MDLSKIISIAGKPGLFQIISQSRGGVIVTSLDNGKKIAIGQSQRVSALSDISMYTVDGDILLTEIFKRVNKHMDGKAIDVDVKDDNAVRAFFTEVVPEHDDSRVYHSDIRKLIKWYNGLEAKGLLSFEEEIEAESSADAEAATEPAADAPEAKKKAPKAQKVASPEKTAEKAAKTPKAESKPKASE
jgi:hypothetical protein